MSRARNAVRIIPAPEGERRVLCTCAEHANTVAQMRRARRGASPFFALPAAITRRAEKRSPLEITDKSEKMCVRTLRILRTSIQSVSRAERLLPRRENKESTERCTFYREPILLWRSSATVRRVLPPSSSARLSRAPPSRENISKSRAKAEQERPLYSLRNIADADGFSAIDWRLVLLANIKKKAQEKRGEMFEHTHNIGAFRRT